MPEFRDPWLLLVALIAPLVFMLASRSNSVLRYSSLLLTDRAPRSLRAKLAKLPALLSAAAVVALAIALAGPRTPDAQTQVSRQGIAIMMVIDRSSSMNARDLVRGDFNVDRLTVVKDVLRQFLLGDDGTSRRPDDAVGLIAFAGYADSLCPLTLDHGNLGLMVNDVEIVNRRDEDGTAIGDGLALAVERLRRSKAKSKVVILLTDGMNTAGAIQPMQAAELAAAHDIKVYSIGAGTQGMAPVPVVNSLTGRQALRRQYVEIDEQTLQDVAERTGGEYFRATDKDGLSDIYDQIDRLERTQISETRYLQYTEHYLSFVIAGLGLMTVAAIADGTVFRTLP